MLEQPKTNKEKKPEQFKISSKTKDKLLLADIREHSVEQFIEFVSDLGYEEEYNELEVAEELFSNISKISKNFTKVSQIYQYIQNRYAKDPIYGVQVEHIFSEYFDRGNMFLPAYGALQQMRHNQVSKVKGIELKSLLNNSPKNPKSVKVFNEYVTKYGGNDNLRDIFLNHIKYTTKDKNYNIKEIEEVCEYVSGLTR